MKVPIPIVKVASSEEYGRAQRKVVKLRGAKANSVAEAVWRGLENAVTAWEETGSPRLRRQAKLDRSR